MAQKTIRKGKKVAGGRSRTDSCGEEAVGSNQLSNVAGDWSRIDSRGKEAVDSNQLSIVAGGRSRAVLRGKEAVGTNQLSIMEAFKRQRGPDCQGPSQRSVLQDDSSVSLIRDNRLQKAVPSGVSTRVNHVTPGPIDQGTSSLAGQEIRSVSGTKRCSSSSDDTEDINTERGSSASSLNPPTKRTKVQEADKRTTIVLPKRRGPVLKVNDDDDEEKPPGSGTSIPPRGRIPASKWYESSFTQDTPMLSRPSKKASPRRTDNGADIAMRERRDPVIMIGDDEEDGMDLSLKPTSRRRPGTLFLSATGRVGLATTAGSGMVSNDAVERNLRDLAARYPAYNVDSLCEVLRANGNGLSAAIRMLDGQTGLDIVEIEGIIDPCSTTCENITDIDGKLAGLVARFPTYEVELLKEILQGCGGNVDEAIAEIELPFSDESETFCEDDVQEHDEEIDQIDDETVNEEDSASIMGDKEVYDSDQEVEDDSEYTDAGEPALPDIEYTDSFERDFYSNFGISSNEVIELQTKFKSRLTAILSHIVHGIAECSFEDLECKGDRWFTAGFWNVLHKYTDEHITMLIDSIENAVLPEVRTVFGMNAPRRELFLGLREVTRSHSHKGIYLDYVVNDNNRERDGIYIGSASGKRGLAGRVTNHKSEISRRKRKSCHYNFIHENNASFNFRVLAVFSQGVNAGQDPATVPSWLIVLLETVMMIMAGSYRYNGFSMPFDNPEVAGLFQVLSINGFGAMYPREPLNRALPIKQDWSAKQLYSCANCATTAPCRFRRAQGALPGTLYLCSSCWFYKQAHKKDKPGPFIKTYKRVNRESAKGQVCDNPNCRVELNTHCLPHPSKDDKWLCVTCHDYLKNKKEDRPKILVQRARLRLRKEKKICAMCHATEATWNKPGEPGTIVCKNCYQKVRKRNEKKNREEKAKKEENQKKVGPRHFEHKVCYRCKTKADGTQWRTFPLDGTRILVCARCYAFYNKKYPGSIGRLRKIPPGSKQCTRCGRKDHTKEWRWSVRTEELVCKSCNGTEREALTTGRKAKTRPVEWRDEAKKDIQTCYHCKQDMKFRRWENTLKEWFCRACFHCIEQGTDLPITREQAQDKECRCEGCETLYSSAWRLSKPEPEVVHQLWCVDCRGVRYWRDIDAIPKRRQYQPAQGSPDVTFQALRWKDKVIDGSENCRAYFRRVHGIDNSIETLAAKKMSAEASNS